MSSSRACFGVVLLSLLFSSETVWAEGLNRNAIVMPQKRAPTEEEIQERAEVKARVQVENEKRAALQKQSDEEFRQKFADDTSGEKSGQAILELVKSNSPNCILEAERMAKSVRKLHPDSPYIIAAASYTAFQHSKLVASPAKRDLYLEAAESLAKKAIAQDSKIEIAQRSLGLVKLAQDQAQEAVEPLRQAVSLDASEVNLTLLAQALLEINPSNKEAGELVSKALAVNFDYNPAHVQQAIIFNAAGKTKEAASELNSVPQSARTSQWYVVQGAVFDKQGDKQAALGALMRASAEDPRNPAPYRFRAEHYAKKGNNELALAEFRAALETCPNDFVMRQKLAELALSLNDLEVAEAEFKTLLTSRPDDPKANLGLAQVGFRKYGKDGPFPADFQYLLDRLETIIGETFLPKNLSIQKSRPIRFREGCSKFVEIIEKHKEHPMDLITLGEQCLFEKEFVDAEKAFRYALAYPETHKRAQDGLDKIEIENYKSMAKTWQPPKFPPSLKNYDSRPDDQGVVLIQQGKLEEAKRAFEESQRLSGKSAESEYYLHLLDKILPKAGDK